MAEKCLLDSIDYTLVFHVHFVTRSQSEDPAVRWQLNLYKDIVMRSEGLSDPERVVDRIQRISAAVFNLEQVRLKRV